MIKKIIYIIIVPVLIYGMKHEDITTIILPAYNGDGGDLYHDMFNLPKEMATKSFTVLRSGNDLCQKNCIQDFNTQITEELRNKNTDFIFYGIGEGAGTMLAWLGKQDPKIQERIKAVILESALVNANETLIHISKELYGLHWPLPSKSYVIPYAAKVLFPSYNPRGPQPIDAVSELSKDAPIIITHNKGDLRTPFSGSVELYEKVYKANIPAYFFSINHTNLHVNIWYGLNSEKRNTYCKALHAIFAKYKLIQAPEVDLSNFQPPENTDCKEEPSSCSLM